MKKGVTKMSNRISAWILTLVMIVGLVAVPAGEVKAAAVSVDFYLDASSKTVQVSDTTVDVTFTMPETYNTTDKLKDAGINKLEVKVKVESYTASGTAGVQAVIECGGKKNWVSWENITYQGQEITITTDLSSYLSNSGTAQFGIQFANVTGSITYQIISAKLVGANWEVNSKDISLTYTAQDLYNDYTKYMFTVENKGESPVSGDLVITFDKGRGKNYWTDNFTIGLNDKVLTISNLTIPAGGKTDAIQVQLTPLGATIVSVTFGNYGGIAATGKTLSPGGNTGNENVSGSGRFHEDETELINTDTEYNFAKLLQYSLYFYDANMCGDVLDDCALNWRGRCHLNQDKKVIYTYYDNNGKQIEKDVDVSGGFHDAGDHDKFGLPQGYTASILGIGYHEFKEAYEKTGQVSHFKTILDYFCDYFVRCTVLDESDDKAIAFCYQVGDGNDHYVSWTAAEDENLDRPVYFTNSTNPATDQVSEAAAALAIHYMNFGNSEYLKYAEKLFEMAQSVTNKATSSNDFYGSSDWEDDYCLAAAWLYKATGKQFYLEEYNAHKESVNVTSEPSWNRVGPYALAYGDENNNFSALDDNATHTIDKTTTISNGYAWFSEWGSARYNCNIQLEGLIYDNHNTEAPHYTEWATGQMKFLLGNSNNKQCYVVGYNENSSKYPHHRTASGYGDWPNNGNNQRQQAHVLLGALVGGIDSTNGRYHDDSNDYYCNEVAIDYNAAFVGATAALYLATLDDASISKQLATEEELKNVGVKKYYGSSESSDPIPLTGVSIESNTDLTKMVAGDTATLNAALNPSNATMYSGIEWKSDDEGVVTVAASGNAGKTAKLTAVKPGKATITVTVKVEDGEDKSATCEVVVTNPIVGFELKPATLDLDKNQKGTLEYTVTPKNTSAESDKYEIKWASDKESVASVDSVDTETHKVTIAAKETGTAVITATLTSGDKTFTSTCTVNVTVPLEGIKLTKDAGTKDIDGEEITIYLDENENQTFELKASPNPADASLGKDIKWTSSDESVATVVGNGATATVTPKRKADTATITVEANGKKATCHVKVRIPVTKIVIPSELEVEKTERTVNLDELIEYYPMDAEDEFKEVTWTSEGSDKISILGNTLTLEEEMEESETATVTAELKNNPLHVSSVSGKIKIVGKKVKSVTVTPPFSPFEIEIDEQRELTATVDPFDADGAKNVEWESLDPDVAAVEVTSPNGKAVVTGVAEGETTIIARAGNQKGTCKVIVTKKKQTTPSSVRLERIDRSDTTITVKGTCAKQENTTGVLEFALADGTLGRALETSNTAIFEGLEPFTCYAFKVRYAASDKYKASSWVNVAETFYTLVSDPSTINVGNFKDSDVAEEYMEALKEAAGNSDYDISFDEEDDKLTILNPKEVTITGDNDGITIVTEDGNYDITLQDTTIKKVDVSASDEVDIHIKGNVTIREGIVSNKVANDKDTDININGDGKDESTLDTPSVRTEGDVTITDVTVNTDASKSESDSEGPAISGENVTITDSKVDATGGDGSPAIEAEGDVTITNSDVTANGGQSTSESEKGGPAISGENVTITDSKVDATGGDGSPAIEAEKDVTIKDSEVDAKGGSDAPAVKGDKVVMENSKVDLEATGGQKGVQANDIVVDNTDVSFNGSKDADLDDIYSVTPKDRYGNDITGNNPNPNPNPNPTPGPGPGPDAGGNGAGNNGTDPTGNSKVQATSLKLTASVKGANNIPVGSSIKLAPKKKITLKVAEFLPEGAESEGVTFTSSKPTVAKVDNSGKITAGRKAGKTTITVTTASGGASKTITVQVMKKAVSKVTIKASKTTINAKKTVKLKATLTPNKKNASNNVFWKSSNTKVATVSASGVVKGVKKGKAKITAVATDGSGKKATITIQVK